MMRLWETEQRKLICADGRMNYRCRDRQPRPSQWGHVWGLPHNSLLMTASPIGLALPACSCLDCSCQKHPGLSAMRNRTARDDDQCVCVCGVGGSPPIEARGSTDGLGCLPVQPRLTRYGTMPLLLLLPSSPPSTSMHACRMGGCRQGGGEPT